MFRKEFAFAIVALFVVAGIFPSVTGSIENKYKTDLSESSLQLPLESIYFVAGLMRIINETLDYLEVKIIFGLWITKGLNGGFFEPNELLYIYGFKGYKLGRVVFGIYDYIVRP